MAVSVFDLFILGHEPDTVGHASPKYAATVVRDTCRTPSAGADAPPFEVLTTATTHPPRTPRAAVAATVDAV